MREKLSGNPEGRKGRAGQGISRGSSRVTIFKQERVTLLEVFHLILKFHLGNELLLTVTK